MIFWPAQPDPQAFESNPRALEDACDLLQAGASQAPAPEAWVLSAPWPAEGRFWPEPSARETASPSAPQTVPTAHSPASAPASAAPHTARPDDTVPRSADAPAPALAQPEVAVHPLTPRELEILGLLAQGLSAKSLARRLSISEGTVRKHRENLRTKLGLRSTVAIVTWAAQHGLLDDADPSGLSFKADDVPKGLPPAPSIAPANTAPLP